MAEGTTPDVKLLGKIQQRAPDPSFGSVRAELGITSKCKPLRRPLRIAFVTNREQPHDFVGISEDSRDFNDRFIL